MNLSPAPPHLRPASFEDYEGIARLGSANTLKTETFEDWRSIWLENPLFQKRAKAWPIGWVLEASGGEIVGSFMNVPSLYKFQGHELICASSRAWAVASDYRGYGLLLIDEFFSQQRVDLKMCTTTGPNSIAVVETFASRIPLGNWEIVTYWVCRHVGVARRRLQRRHVPLARLLSYPMGWALLARDALSKPLPRPCLSFSIEAVERFDSRFDVFWNELVTEHSGLLLADRSTKFLSWHFGVPMRHGRLWIFAAFKARKLRAYCIFTKIEQGNDRHVRLVDYQSLDSEVDLLPSLLWAGLNRCKRENILRLENVGLGVPKMRALDDHAPHRRRLPSWRFFYRATSSELDMKLRSKEFWDPSVYDGDASLG